MIIAIALICGGMVHTIVALWGFLKNELFTALVFGTYGAFWTIFSLFQLGLVLEWFEVDPSMMTVFFIAWTIFTFIIWIATLVTNTAVIVIITTLLIVFILLVLGLAQLAGLCGHLYRPGGLIYCRRRYFEHYVRKTSPARGWSLN